MKRVAVVVVATTAAIGFALRHDLAGSKTMYLVIAAVYAVLAGWALYEMWDDGTLLDRLSPRWGDLSLGVVVAGVLFAGSWVGRSLIAASGTPGQAWLFHIYLQLGNPANIERSLVITVLLLLVPLLEEIVWRGMVLSHLTQKFGQRRAWPLAALLYAVSVSPTIFTLADPVAGKNPLLFVAALGCGIFWSFLASVTNRLPPVIISHIAFTYFSVTQFRAPGL